MISEQKSDDPKAAQYLTLAAMTSEGDYQLWVRSADRHHMLGQLQQACYCYGRAIKIQKDSPELLKQRAHCFEKLGDTAKATMVYQKLRKIAPSKAADPLARIYEQSGKLEQALEVLDQSLKSEEELHLVNLQSGIRLKLKKYKECRATLEEIQEKMNRTHFPIQLDIKLLLARTNLKVEAEDSDSNIDSKPCNLKQQAEEALILLSEFSVSKYGDLYLQVAHMFQNLQRYKEALHIYRSMHSRLQAQEKEETYSYHSPYISELELMFKIGLNALQSAELDIAEDHFKRCISAKYQYYQEDMNREAFNKLNTQARLYLSQVYKKLGEERKALKILTKPEQVPMEGALRDDFERFPKRRIIASDSDYIPSESQEQRNSEDSSSFSPSNSHSEEEQIEHIKPTKLNKKRSLLRKRKAPLNNIDESLESIPLCEGMNAKPVQSGEAQTLFQNEGLLLGLQQANILFSSQNYTLFLSKVLPVISHSLAQLEFLHFHSSRDISRRDTESLLTQNREEEKESEEIEQLGEYDLIEEKDEDQELILTTKLKKKSGLAALNKSVELKMIDPSTRLSSQQIEGLIKRTFAFHIGELNYKSLLLTSAKCLLKYPAMGNDGDREYNKRWKKANRYLLTKLVNRVQHISSSLLNSQTKQCLLKASLLGEIMLGNIEIDGVSSSCFYHARSLTKTSTNPMFWFFMLRCREQGLRAYLNRLTSVKEGDQRNPAPILLLAYHYIQHLSLDLALDKLRILLKVAPQYPLFNFLIALCALLRLFSRNSDNARKEQDFARAIGFLERYAHSETNKAEVNYNLARAFHYIGQYTSARNLYERAIVVAESSQIKNRALFNLKILLREMKQPATSPIYFS